MSVPEKFLERRFKLESSENQNEFLTVKGISFLGRFILRRLAAFREGFITITPINYGNSYQFESRVLGRKRTVRFEPGRPVQTIGFDGKRVESSFRMEGDRLKETRRPLTSKGGDGMNVSECVYYDVTRDGMTVDAYLVVEGESRKSTHWRMYYTTTDPVPRKIEYCSHLEDTCLH